MWDLANDPHSIALIETMFCTGRPLALVCHGPGALRYTMASNGRPLVAGKSVTGISNLEEAAIELTDVVPFLVEDMLRNNGGNYSRKEKWQPYAVSDGDLRFLDRRQNIEWSCLVAPEPMRTHYC